MPLLTSLLLLLVLCRVFGEILKRLGQPSLVGEILAGIVLGPSVLGYIHTSEALSGISDLAVFLIVLSAGLEMNFQEVMASFRGKGLIVAALGFIIPFFGGFGVGALYSMEPMHSVFLGLCIAITALPVALRILDGFGMIKSDIGKFSVSAAILNDVVALLMLAVIIGLPNQSSISEAVVLAGTVVGKLLIFGALVLAMNWLLETLLKRGVRIDWLIEKITMVLGREALFGIVVTFVLVFSVIGESLGSHFVIGAFFGALMIDRKLFLHSHYKEFEGTLNSMTQGFLAPIFFGYLGLEFHITALKDIDFVVVVLIVSVVTKIFAGWLGGSIVGLPKREALGLGVILNGRGIMELVVASIALRHGFIGPDLFATLVLMGVLTTLVTPILFRKLRLEQTSSE
jgi:Kef-type K+ transport system membrane component KefB